MVKAPAKYFMQGLIKATVWEKPLILSASHQE